MTSLACRTALTLLALMGIWSTAGAQQMLIDRTYDPKTKTRLNVTCLISELPTSGYAPVRVTINNNTKFDRTWTFRFTSSDTGWSNEGNEIRSSFTASCASGQNLAFEFLVPLVTAFQQGYSSSTNLDVMATAPAMPPASGSMDTEYDPAWPSVFLSDTLQRRNGSNLTAEARTRLSGGSSATVEFGGAFSAKNMSDDWRAYVGYDVCLLTDTDWRDLSPGARSALLQWNRLGGRLHIFATSPATDVASLGIDGIPQGTRTATRSWGELKIKTIPSTNMLDGKTTVRDVASPPKGTRHRLPSVRDDFRTSWPLQNAFGAKTAHIIFFILVLIAFGVLVGPINLFVFAKSGQRHRLFITTPIISVGASLLLIVLIIFQDGFGGRGSRLLLMEVRPDNTENAAYVAQEQIARTGVLFATGFTTSEPCYISPVMIAESRWARVTASNDGGNSRYTIDVEENGLKVGGDWFQSRSEHGHVLETVRPTRGRIELVANSSAPVVTSTFEFPLATLFYIDGDGDHWKAENVLQGRNTQLNSITASEFSSWLGVQRTRFAEKNRQRLDITANRQEHFVAITDEAPATDTLESINWKDTTAVITGPVVNP